MEINNLLSVTLRKNPDFDPNKIDLVQMEQKLQTLLAAKGVSDTIMIGGKEVSLFGSDGMMMHGVYQIIDPSELKEDAVSIITTCWDISDDELIDLLVESTNTQPEQIVIQRTGARTTTTPLKFNFFKGNHSPAGGGSSSVIPPTTPPEGPAPTPPSDPPETPTTPPTDPKYTLTRKNNSQNNKTFSVNDSEEIEVELYDPTTGEHMYYKIKAKSGSENVTIKFLDNYRFLIIGDNIEINAYAGQNDNIILIGSNNNVYTNDGNDTVRIGDVLDSVSSLFDNKQSNGNYVSTGSGDDYVIVYGWSNYIDGGGNNDSVRFTINTVEYSTTTGENVIHDVENKYSRFEATETSDGKLAGSSQGQYGDCKYLAFLNSFRYWLQRTGHSLSEYVRITPSGDSYTVEFRKSSETITVSQSEISQTKNADGDLDNVLLEIAFRKILESNGFNMNDGDDSNSLGDGRNSYLISKYLFNTTESIAIQKIIKFESGSSIDNTDNFDEQFRELLAAYNAKTISNLTVATGGNASTNKTLGIMGNHAYAVIGGVPGEYVELVNPWDGNDTIKLDWTDFIRYFNSVLLYGDASDWAKSKNYDNALISNESGFGWVSSSNQGGSAPSFNFLGETQQIAVYDELSEMEDYINNVKNMMNIERKFELYT